MASKKGKAIRFFEDEMSGRRYDWSGGKRVGSGNTDSASVPERNKFVTGRKPTTSGQKAEAARLKKKSQAYKRPGAMRSEQQYSDYMKKTPAQKTAKGKK